MEDCLDEVRRMTIPALSETMESNSKKIEPLLSDVLEINRIACEVDRYATIDKVNQLKARLFITDCQ